VVSNRLTPTTTSSPDSIRAARSRASDQLALHVAGLDGRDRPAHLLHPVDLGAGARDQLGDLGLDDPAAVEQVSYSSRSVS
jgi:hypothetical protein